jgi:hypothetical protein
MGNHKRRISKAISSQTCQKPPVPAVASKARASCATMLSIRSLQDAKMLKITRSKFLPLLSTQLLMRPPSILPFQRSTSAKPPNSKILSWECAGSAAGLGVRWKARKRTHPQMNCYRPMSGDNLAGRVRGELGDIQRLSQSRKSAAGIANNSADTMPGPVGTLPPVPRS